MTAAACNICLETYVFSVFVAIQCKNIMCIVLVFDKGCNSFSKHFKAHAFKTFSLIKSACFFGSLENFKRNPLYCKILIEH
jgi:hypothetical protein